MADFYVSPSLFRGREGAFGRSEAENKCYDMLERLGIEFYRADHSPADTVASCQVVEGVIGVGVCKNLFLCNRSMNRFYLLMMPALKPFKTKIFSKLVSSPRLSFAPSEYMSRYLGVTPGSVSVLGLQNDTENRVVLAIDADILRAEFIRCHPCINTSTLKIKTADLLEKLLPAMGHEPLTVEQPWEISENN